MNKAIQIAYDKNFERVCKFASEAGFKNPDYYKAKNIPAAGYYLKDEDNEDSEQTSLF